MASNFPQHSPVSRIFFLTDSEGDPRPFFSAIQQSSIVNVHSDKGLVFQPMKEKPYFIFGGDVTDRGSYDLLITELLIDFKKRHPDQVFLLIGNRDVSKNRLKIELSPRFIRERLLKNEDPRWPRKLPSLPKEYVQRQMIAEKSTLTSLEEYINAISIEKCQIIYLKWMLETTMGCPHSFRYRREELSRNRPQENITDVDVLHSFMTQVHPEGVSTQYLQLAQPIIILPHSNIIAMHGGLQPYNIGRIPDMSPDDKPILNLKNWIQQFNKWYQQQIEAWLTFQPTCLTPPACTALDECVLPMPGMRRSIITADMLDATRQFVPIPEAVVNYLKANKVQLVLTGHQPNGDMPIILRDKGLLFINGDTGYSALNKTLVDDTREGAFHTLELAVNEQTIDIEIQALLTDKTKITTHLSIINDRIEGDPYIGCITKDHYLVQCRLPNGEYRLVQQKGLEVKYSIVNVDVLKQQLNIK